MPESVNSRPHNDYYLPDDKYVVKDKPGGLSDPNAFLKILVAQMKYQNPMQPTDSDTFISQLTQMANMEQMGNVSKSMNNLASKYEMSRYYELIGHQVSLIKGDELITGQVGGVIIEKEKPYFYLADAPNGPKYNLEQITSITSQNQTTTDILPYLALVGQQVKVNGSDGPIEGIIEKVLLQNGSPALQVNGQLFHMEDLIELISHYVDVEQPIDQPIEQPVEQEQDQSPPADSTDNVDNSV